MAYFYDKKNPFRRTQMSDSQMSLMYPKTFQEYQFHFYVKFLDLESRREAEEYVHTHEPKKYKLCCTLFVYIQEIKGYIHTYI